MVSAFVDSREAGTVDVRLNPKELGSVQMTLKAQDGGLALAILAERPETLDLMRRHIDQLSAEFRAMGYSDVAFSFGNRDTGAGSSRQETQDRPQVISSGADIEHGEADAGRSKISTGTLDIRL
ncbi:flagellar hook-length control protein FliK [Ruegeria marina]|nr:flagellar hook-length control protein FliK [Ruegeria marina]